MMLAARKMRTHHKNPKLASLFTFQFVEPSFSKKGTFEKSELWWPVCNPIPQVGKKWQLPKGYSVRTFRQGVHSLYSYLPLGRELTVVVK